MKVTNQNFRLVTYGRWQRAIVDGEPKDKAFLETQSWLEDVGVSQECGTLKGEKARSDLA